MFGVLRLVAACGQLPGYPGTFRDSIKAVTLHFKSLRQPDALDWRPSF
jgi:hypothetical protein